MLGVKQVVFKSRKVISEYCTICDTFLTGNGSLVHPWMCTCGVYEYSWIENRYLHPKENKKGETSTKQKH